MASSTLCLTFTTYSRPVVGKLRPAKPFHPASRVFNAISKNAAIFKKVLVYTSQSGVANQSEDFGLRVSLRHEFKL